MLEMIGVLALSTMVLLLPVHFFLMYRLFRYLEEQHPERYAQLGRPTLVLRNSIESNFRVLRFLFRREYVELDDAALARISTRIVVLVIVYTVAFVTALFVFFT